MADHDAFWASIRRAASDVEHRLNLAGRELATCPGCDGARHTEPSRIDCDAHGSYYVSAVDCRQCGGRGRVEVACSSETKQAALRKEINTMQAELKALDGNGG